MTDTVPEEPAPEPAPEEPPAHPFDLTALSDEDLDALCADIIHERDRRQQIAETPIRIREMVTGYLDIGGDPADLTLEPMPKPEPVPEWEPPVGNPPVPQNPTEEFPETGSY